jgi:hypothetical protein
MKVSGLGGLLDVLIKRFGGSVYDQKVVVITASSNGEMAKNVVDYGSASGYESAVGPKYWLGIDFKTVTIKTNSYSVRGLAGVELDLRDWAVDGSNDGENWFPIDHRSQTDVLNGANATRTFWTFREKEDRQVLLRSRSSGCCSCETAKTKLSSQI